MSLDIPVVHKHCSFCTDKIVLVFQMLVVTQWHFVSYHRYILCKS